MTARMKPPTPTWVKATSIWLYTTEKSSIEVEWDSSANLYIDFWKWIVYRSNVNDPNTAKRIAEIFNLAGFLDANTEDPYPRFYWVSAMNIERAESDLGGPAVIPTPGWPGVPA